MNDINEEIMFDTNFGEKKTNSIIKVIGIGGAGNNAVQQMYTEGIIGVDFMVCNTDRQALEQNAVPAKLVLGDTGLGAGADPIRARELALKSKDDIRELIGEETKMLFITAGMGKGTGTGAAPVVAQIAREMNLLTIAVVTYPYDFEQPRCKSKADKGIEELKKYVDSLIIIQNQKIIDEYENETFRVALGYANDVVKNAVKCIAELITVEGSQNVDFNDVQTIMRNSGEAMLGLAEASGENRIEEVVSHAMTSPLIDDTNIGEANNFLFFVRYGKDAELKVSELKKLNKEFEAYKNADTNVIWGHALDESLGDMIKLSVIITNYSKNRIGIPEINSKDTLSEIPVNTINVAELINGHTQEELQPVVETPITDSVISTPAPVAEPVFAQSQPQTQVAEPVTASYQKETLAAPAQPLNSNPQPISTNNFVFATNQNDIYSNDQAFKQHVTIPAYQRNEQIQEDSFENMNAERILNTKRNSNIVQPEYSIDSLIFGKANAVD